MRYYWIMDEERKCIVDTLGATVGDPVYFDSMEKAQKFLSQKLFMFPAWRYTIRSSAQRNGEEGGGRIAMRYWIMDEERKCIVDTIGGTGGDPVYFDSMEKAQKFLRQKLFMFPAWRYTIRSSGEEELLCN